MSPFQQRQEAESDVAKALAWCRSAPKGKKRGAIAAVRSGLFPRAAKAVIQNCLTKGLKAVPMDKRYLLSTDEEALFVNWLKECALAQKACDRDQMARYLLAAGAAVYLGVAGAGALRV